MFSIETAFDFNKYTFLILQIKKSFSLFTMFKLFWLILTAEHNNLEQCILIFNYCFLGSVIIGRLV